MLNTEEIAGLIKKQLDGKLTTDEELQLQFWGDTNPVNKVFLRQVLRGDLLWEDVLIWLELENGEQEEWQKRLERKVFAMISEPAPNRDHFRILRRIIPYAAAVLLFAMAGSLYYYYYLDRGEQIIKNIQVINDVAPGGNKATLTLTGGHTIELSGDKNGIIMGEALTYDDGTLLTATTTSENKNEEIVSFLVLTTPRGGQYQVSLPDGTKVWLNAASTLRYPARFSDEKRVVELEGEAYFEVAHKDNSSQKVPFLVKTSNQIIEVLGTHFNVSAYNEESKTMTTLIEGSVLLISNGENLKLIPGEQGVSDDARLTKAKVDVMAAIAWKSNKFIFNETELGTAMNQLSRWYDVQVIYEENIPQTYFYGEISRDKSLLEVLKILEEGGVNFRIEKLKEENRLIVLP